VPALGLKHKEREMLVLTRRKAESIEISIGGTVVRIVVSSIAGDRVRIGIDAPREVRIVRAELAEQDRQRPAA